jgi:solute carrier family 25 folate transporter 32
MRTADATDAAWPHDKRARDALAGAAAGICNVLALHPLDVVKTRLQGALATCDVASSRRALALRRTAAPRSARRARGAGRVPRHGARLQNHPARGGTQHASLGATRRLTHAPPSLPPALAPHACSRARCATSRAQGWRGLYAGLSPALVGGTLAWGLYFAAYNHAKERYARWTHSAELPPAAHLAAAAEAGVAVSLLTNPIWVAKTRLQLQRRAPAVAAHAPPAAHYRGLAHALARIGAEEGLRGLYRGLLPSLALVSHGALQFTAYEALKKRALAREGRLHSADGEEAAQAARLSGATAGALGVASKLIASTVTYPSQVLRSRLQQRSAGAGAAAASGSGSGGGALRTLRGLVAREGVRGLYKGFVPNVLRVLPSSALTFLVYETASQAMERRGTPSAE